MNYGQWEAARENCDINQKWSGAIVERDGRPYAYFCEIAAALDGGRGENNGMLALPGWWKNDVRVPATGDNAFINQIKTCCDRGCGVPLRLRSRQDDEETYDNSDYWLGKLQSRGAQSVTYTPTISRDVQHTHEVTDYMDVRRPK
jgi:hypothetical protein